MLELATELIDRQQGKFQPSDAEDRYEARLRDVIEAKLKGEGIAPEEPATPDRGNVVDLMAALKASLGKADDTTPKKRSRAVPSPGKTATSRTPSGRGNNRATSPKRQGRSA